MSSTDLPIEFNIAGIKTEQFAVFEKNYSSKKDVELNTNIQFKIDNENHRIGCFLSFEFVQGTKVFLKIEVSCHFVVGAESWKTLINLESSELVIPKGFLAHMAMLTTGTSRGILFSKTEGSNFSKFIIPPINVEEMIPEDGQFGIEL